MSTNTEDESFHPLGEEWEDQLTEMLDDTEYDTDLGLAMAEDAQRLVAGELSEAEFHGKYHERVLEEFGEDERPTAEAFAAREDAESGGLLDALASFDGDGEESRRELMKKMGAGGAFLGLGALATTDNAGNDGVVSADEDDTHGTQWGMTIDLEVCDGCLSCVTACSEENNLDQGVNWMYVLAYEDSQVSVPDDPDSVRDYPLLVRPCQHCTDAPCEKVCPTTARHTRSKDGLVLTDYDICIGCRYCQVACPYGVNYFQWDEPDVSESDIEAQAQEMGMDGDHIHADGRPVDSRAPRGVMSKCTFCPTRQDGYSGDDKVGTTACMDACPPGAIQFGDVNDETSDASIYSRSPALGRALEEEVDDAPDPETLAEQLQGESDLGLDGLLELIEEGEAAEEDADEAEDEADEAAEEAEEDEDDEEAQEEAEEAEEEAEEAREEADEFSAITDLDRELIGLLGAVSIYTDDWDVDTDDSRERALGPLIGKARDLVGVLEEAGVDFEDDDTRQDLRLGDGSAGAAEERLQSAKGTHESRFKLLEDIGTNPNVTYIGHEPGPDAEQVPGPVAYELSYNRADGSSPSLVDDRKDVLDESTVGGFF